MVKIVKIRIPEYTVLSEPDHRSIGKKVDEKIIEAFLGRKIVARGISLDSHHEKSIDELTNTITKLGTDRYDQTIAGDRYDNTENKHIDLFGFRRKVTEKLTLFSYICWGFYHSAQAVHGKPSRIDIVTIYDATKLKAVLHHYEGSEKKKRDGFIFVDPQHKPNAVLGIVQLLR